VRDDEAIIARRAEVLRRLLGARAPRRVRWLPVVGVVAGLGTGVLVWRGLGSGFLLGREIAIAVGGLVGLAWGAVARTRVGAWLATLDRGAPADLPREFRDLPVRRDPRDEAFERHRRL
jgi:hypothetical protein